MLQKILAPVQTGFENFDLRGRQIIVIAVPVAFLVAGSMILIGQLSI
jgi:hypothetical protein